jgi:cobalt-precorrin-5B (C1)-methyltransferase
MSKKKRSLRNGFTTGTAAAAATKGALHYLLSRKKPSVVNIPFLSTGAIDIAIQSCKKEDAHTAVCTVIKDAGDDPDITHKAEIGARVSFLKNNASQTIDITGGQGIGIVTKPGLEIAPGEPAINPGPRKMIHQAITDSFLRFNQTGAVHVEIFIPNGEVLALKTLNARLGISGGLSILGTTGIEKPLSHESYIATIDASLSVAKASGCRQIVFTTGRRSERFVQHYLEHVNKRPMPEEMVIQMGDFFTDAINLAKKKDFFDICVAVFFGKAIKMAMGALCTHAAKSSLSITTLSQWAEEITGDRIFSKKIQGSNTAREAFFYILEQYPVVIEFVGQKVMASAQNFAGSSIKIGCIIFDYEGRIVFKDATI